MMKFAVLIPVFNGGPVYAELLAALDEQSSKPDIFLVVDSGSQDGSAQLSERHGATVVRIASSEFNHGGTRNLALSMLPDGIEVAVYLTQDAVPSAPDTLERIVSHFSDASVGACFGRQLPRRGATEAEAFARLTNYTDVSYRTDLRADVERTFSNTFFSNSFAAYRVSALREAGGFPQDVIFGEDVLANIAILEQGWVTEYVADAKVFHSHDYTIGQEFRRYFDIGVMHERSADALAPFGKPTGRGKAYAIAEMKEMARLGAVGAVVSVTRSAAKFLGYKFGRMESRLPLWLKYRLSMHRRFWASH